MIDDEKMGKLAIHELETPLNQYEGMTWADFDNADFDWESLGHPKKSCFWHDPFGRFRQ